MVPWGCIVVMVGIYIWTICNIVEFTSFFSPLQLVWGKTIFFKSIIFTWAYSPSTAHYFFYAWILFGTVNHFRLAHHIRREDTTSPVKISNTTWEPRSFYLGIFPWWSLSVIIQKRFSSKMMVFLWPPRDGYFFAAVISCGTHAVSFFFFSFQRKVTMAPDFLNNISQLPSPPKILCAVSNARYVNTGQHEGQSDLTDVDL